MQLTLLWLALLGLSARGYYVSEIARRGFRAGDELFINVNSLTSANALIPFDYYSLPFCQNFEHRQQEERLGEILWGDRIEQSNYSVTGMINEQCRLVSCPRDYKLTPDGVKAFISKIDLNYRAGMILDNFPVVTKDTTAIHNPECTVRDHNLRGVRIGLSARCNPHANLNDPVLFNHLDFTIEVSEEKEEGDVTKNFVVGFYVTPKSINHSPDVKDSSSCVQSIEENKNNPLLLNKNLHNKPVVWSYSVTWVRNNEKKWATRWDSLLNLSLSAAPAEKHWESIIKALILTILLAAVVAYIVMRTLHLDFNRYNSLDEDEGQEEVGWKLVHADVFRPPVRTNMFCVVIGTGVQLFGMAVFTIFFALLGLLSPAIRGALLSALILLFALMAFVNGYITGMLQNMFHCKKWKYLFLSGLMFPGMVFLFWAIAEIMFVVEHANKVPFITFLQIMGLWFGISIPLVIIGASFSHKRPPIEPPIAVKQNPRPIPPQRWYMSTWATMLVGLLPCAAAKWELGLIFDSVWQGLVYYLFAFLAVTFVVVVIITIELVIVVIYYQLVYEDWRWWWRSVQVPASMSIYVFIYCIIYYYTSLRIKTFAGFILFMEFAVTLSVALAFMMGAIGFFGSWAFVHKIYTSVKVE